MQYQSSIAKLASKPTQMQRVILMTSHNPKDVREELVDLFELQLRILEKEVFGDVTEAELREYERRRDRIRELHDQIFAKQAAA